MRMCVYVYAYMRMSMRVCAYELYTYVRIVIRVCAYKNAYIPIYAYTRMFISIYELAYCLSIVSELLF